MGQEFDPPAPLRFFSRKFALSSEAPPGKTFLSLQNMNTARLQDGAVCMIYSVGGASEGVTGFRSFYVFDRNYSGPAINSLSFFTPIAGGGAWRRQGAYSLYSSDVVFNRPVQPVVLTAGGGVTLVHEVTQLGVGRVGQANMRLSTSTTLVPAAPGAVVKLDLEVAFYELEEVPSFNIADSRTVTLGSGDTIVPLFSSTIVPTNNFFDYRIRGTATVQNATVPSEGVTVCVDTFFIAGGT